MSVHLARDFDEDQCVICRNLQSSASNLAGVVFLTHRCGHRFCQRCIDREFSIKNKFACPAPNCKAIVERRGLTEQDLDEAEVEKDARIRKRIKAIYNKIAEDFPSMDQFRDYEEEVEDIIFNLANNIDVDEANARVEKYKSDNMKVIMENQSKQSVEWQILSEKIEQQEKLRQSATDLQKEEGALEKQRKHAKIEEMNRIAIGDLGNDDESSSQLQQASKPLSTKQEDPAAAKEKENKSKRSILNPVYLTLGQRPEPRRKVVNSSSKVHQVNSDQLRAMYVSGGYDFTNNQRRNWQEISFAAVFEAMKLRDKNSTAALAAEAAATVGIKQEGALEDKIKAEVAVQVVSTSSSSSSSGGANTTSTTAATTSSIAAALSAANSKVEDITQRQQQQGWPWPWPKKWDEIHHNNHSNHNSHSHQHSHSRPPAVVPQS